MITSICVHLEVAYVVEDFAPKLARSLHDAANRILQENCQGGTVVVYGVPLYRDSVEPDGNKATQFAPAHAPECHCGRCWADKALFSLKGDGKSGPSLSMNGENALKQRSKQ